MDEGADEDSHRPRPQRAGGHVVLGRHGAAVRGQENAAQAAVRDVFEEKLKTAIIHNTFYSH